MYHILDCVTQAGCCVFYHSEKHLTCSWSRSLSECPVDAFSPSALRISDMAVKTRAPWHQPRSRAVELSGTPGGIDMFFTFFSTHAPRRRRKFLPSSVSLSRIATRPLTFLRLLNIIPTHRSSGRTSSTHRDDAGSWLWMWTEGKLGISWLQKEEDMRKRLSSGQSSLPSQHSCSLAGIHSSLAALPYGPHMAIPPHVVVLQHSLSRRQRGRAGQGQFTPCQVYQRHAFLVPWFPVSWIVVVSFRRVRRSSFQA